MNILGVGPMELLLVFVLAFFLLGPKRMTETAKTLGKLMRELQRQRREFTSLLMQEAEKPAPEPAPPAPPPPQGVVSRPVKTAAATRVPPSSTEQPRKLPPASTAPAEASGSAGDAARGKGD